MFSNLGMPEFLLLLFIGLGLLVTAAVVGLIVWAVVRASRAPVSRVPVRFCSRCGAPVDAGCEHVRGA